MRVEREIQEGEEVFNSYGDMGDGRLLVEWGFVEEGFAGDGLTWEIDELGGHGRVKSLWAELVERDEFHLAPKTASSSRHGKGPRESGTDGEDERQEEEGRLLSPTLENKPGLLNLSQSGEVSINLWAYTHLKQICEQEPGLDIEQAESKIRRSADELETVWSRIQADMECDIGQVNGDFSLVVSKDTARTAKVIRNLIRDRLEGMHQPHLSLNRLFELRDVSLSITSGDGVS